MKCYRIKHIETGLYYRPCVGTGIHKTNLGIKGKVYTSYPKKSPVWEKGYIVNISEKQIQEFPHLVLAKYKFYGENGVYAAEQTWEVEEL